MGIVERGVNLITIGTTQLYLPDYDPIDRDMLRHHVKSRFNTERELAVPPTCPDLYQPLAAELSKQLGRAVEPPLVVDTSWLDRTPLIETTSGHPVALRLVLPTRSGAADGELSRSIAILLPEGSNLVDWFSVLLCELHEVDPTQVPQAPPRLSQPSDWYTPEERVVADRISQIESKLECLAARPRII